MPGNQPPEGSAARLRLVSNALWLVSVSVPSASCPAPSR